MNMPIILSRDTRGDNGRSNGFELPAFGSFRVDLKGNETSFYRNVAMEAGVIPAPSGGVIVRTLDDGALVRLFRADEIVSISKLDSRR